MAAALVRLLRGRGEVVVEAVGVRSLPEPNHEEGEPGVLKEGRGRGWKIPEGDGGG
jgi:hypothetical protein